MPRLSISRPLLLLVAIACHGGKDGDSTDSTPTSGDDTAATTTDADQDGWASPDDCDDHDASVHPDAPEDGGDGYGYGNGVDDDCDGTTDDGTLSYDDDGDGWAEVDGDCDDADDAVHPGAAETPGDEVDPNCDGSDAGPVIELSDADYTWSLADPLHEAGYAVAFAGDLDGDGNDDILVGAPDEVEQDIARGAVYLVASSDPERNLADSPVFDTDQSWDSTGRAIAGAGDVNGDGLADVLIGSPNHAMDGLVYLFHGPLSLEESPDTAAATWFSDDESIGMSVSSAGDVDGDGLDDVMFGAAGLNGSEPGPGRAFLFLAPFRGTSTPDEADATLTGLADGSYFGQTIAPAGDVDGDGHPDFVVGAIKESTTGDEAGAAYVFLAPLRGSLDTSDAALAVYGETDDAEAGYSVASAGDVDGNGLDDVLVSAMLDSQVGDRAGATYLLLAPFDGTETLATADARIFAEQPYDWFGRQVGSAGDFDADGQPDFFVAAPRDYYLSTEYIGKAYVFTSPPSGDASAADADLLLVGEGPWDFAASSVAGGGDFDGDGFDDLAVGAPLSDEGADAGGKVYLVRGGPR